MAAVLDGGEATTEGAVDATGGCWEVAGADFGGTGGGADEAADEEAGRVEDAGRKATEDDEEGAITGADESGDRGSEGAARDGEETDGGEEERDDKAGGNGGRSTGAEISETGAVAGGGESDESELSGGGDADVTTTPGWEDAEAVEMGGVGRKYFWAAIGDPESDGESMGMLPVLGELKRDEGKLPGRLDGDASCGDNTRLLLEVAGGEGWLSRDVERVWVGGDARELGGGTFLINRPFSS